MRDISNLPFMAQMHLKNAQLARQGERAVIDTLRKHKPPAHKAVLAKPELDRYRRMAKAAELEALIVLLGD